MEDGASCFAFLWFVVCVTGLFTVPFRVTGYVLRTLLFLDFFYTIYLKLERVTSNQGSVLDTKPSHKLCTKRRTQSTVLSTSLGKTFFAWRFILNENILF